MLDAVGDAWTLSDAKIGIQVGVVWLDLPHDCRIPHFFWDEITASEGLKRDLWFQPPTPMMLLLLAGRFLWCC